MAALPHDEISTPVAQAATIIERLERQARGGELTPEQHRGMLHRLHLLETEFKLLRPHGASTWPEAAVADFGIAVALQAVLLRASALDAGSFEHGLAKMRLALHEMNLWGTGVRAFPPRPPLSAETRRIGRFTLIEGGRA